MTFSCGLRIKAVCIFYGNHTVNENMFTCASKVIIASYWLQYLSFLSVFSCISSSVITILRSVWSALVDALRKESPHCSRGRFLIQLFHYSLFVIDLFRTTLFELIVWRIDSYWPKRKEESDAKKRLSGPDPTAPTAYHTQRVLKTFLFQRTISYQDKRFFSSSRFPSFLLAFFQRALPVKDGDDVWMVSAFYRVALYNVLCKKTFSCP